MTKLFDPILELIDAEFRGKSWNGLSFLPTLEKLTAKEAADGNTWEGYSAWEIALHCAMCKRIVAKDLGLAVPDWPYPEGVWFPAPADQGEASWARDKALLVELHEASMRALRGMDEAVLESEMPSWKAPWKQVLVWLTTHDSFHGAQIRSMGLPALREKKH
ncbi:MAG: hypothetical protein JNG85_03780, partial [Spirochaetaceae bacterium]|nr:hypothetical protein [Spirochaetaceae bacterium]